MITPESDGTSSVPHFNIDRLHGVTDIKFGFLVARLPQIEDADAGIIRHAATIAKYIGFTIAINVMAYGYGVSTR